MFRVGSKFVSVRVKSVQSESGFVSVQVGLLVFRVEEWK